MKFIFTILFLLIVSLTIAQKKTNCEEVKLQFEFLINENDAEKALAQKGVINFYGKCWLDNAQNVKDVKKYEISKKFLKDSPGLVFLILTSKSIEKVDDKQSWFSLYDKMNIEQINRFWEILVKERIKLQEIEKNYKVKNDSLNLTENSFPYKLKVSNSKSTKDCDKQINKFNNDTDLYHKDLNLTLLSYNRYNTNCFIEQVQDSILEFEISSLMKKNDPLLIYLLLISESIGTKRDKQDWFKLYDQMDIEQKNRLKEILLKEKEERRKIIKEFEIDQFNNLSNEILQDNNNQKYKSNKCYILTTIEENNYADLNKSSLYKAFKSEKGFEYLNNIVPSKKVFKLNFFTLNHSSNAKSNQQTNEYLLNYLSSIFNDRYKNYLLFEDDINYLFGAWIYLYNYLENRKDFKSIYTISKALQSAPFFEKFSTKQKEIINLQKAHGSFGVGDLEFYGNYLNDKAQSTTLEGLGYDLFFISLLERKSPNLQNLYKSNFFSRTIATSIDSLGLANDLAVQLLLVEFVEFSVKNQTVKNKSSLLKQELLKAYRNADGLSVFKNADSIEESQWYYNLTKTWLNHTFKYAENYDMLEVQISEYEGFKSIMELNNPVTKFQPFEYITYYILHDILYTKKHQPQELLEIIKKTEAKYLEDKIDNPCQGWLEKYILLELKEYLQPTPFTQSRKNKAILIAAEKYNTNWTTLINPIKDVNDIGNLLYNKFSFDTTMVYNPTWEQFDEALNKSINTIYNENDQLFILITGHGMLLNNSGYFVPVDAQRGKTRDLYDFAAIKQKLESHPCKHIYLVLDVCHSGRFFPIERLKGANVPDVKTKNGDEKYILEQMKGITRKAITSSGLEEASDGEPGVNSPFIYKFKNYLEAIPSGEIRGSKQIGGYITELNPNNKQTPKTGGFGLDNSSSDFIFIAK